MTTQYFSSAWPAVASALGNHLWQSTLFAIAAGLLTLTLRRNHARARYWLWLAASVKFLVPFSLLTSMGNHLAWSRDSAGSTTGLYLAMEQFGQPFAQPAAPVISQASASTALWSLHNLLPALVAVWLCGFLVVFFVWGVRWRRVSSALRTAQPVREGREVETLRRLEPMGGIRKRIEMFLSRTSLEPGIFGIARPVLIWPQGISKHLEDAHLEAILAHELWHVRRRDNLAAAIHMVVEAIFWFHPLVWWLGARMVEERERACDEEVLESGTERHVYAESILKVCEFCVGSPLACVSGVTGADLKKRMVHIMTNRILRKLDFSKKLLLGVAGVLAIALPIAFGLVHATPSRAAAQSEDLTTSVPTYEAVSIKRNRSEGVMQRILMLRRPDGFTAMNGTLPMLVGDAYGVEYFQISGLPEWPKSEKYDIEAKMDSAAVGELKRLSEGERDLAQKRMLQALLSDRFQLKVHRETKSLPEYALVVAENGPKLKEGKPGDTYPNGIKGPDGGSGAGIMMMGLNGPGLTAQGVPISNLVRMLSQQLGRTVVDRTGLAGKYDFTLQWTPDPSQTPMFKGANGGQPPADNPPSPGFQGVSIFTALQQQLGLKLEPQQGPVDMVVIDHVEMPTED
jgi:bla regulator protein blaR1